MVFRKMIDHSMTDGINSLSGKGMAKAVAVPYRAVRSVFDGLTGSSAHNYGAKQWRDKNGEAVVYNPIRKTTRRAGANLETMLTGRRTHANTREVLKKDEGIHTLGPKAIWNRGWAATHFVGNMTVGMAGASLGWGVKGAATLVGGGAIASARPMARFIGAATYETAGTLHEMGRGVQGLARGNNAVSARTSDMLLLGSFGAAAIGGLALASDSFSDKGYTGYAESVPGTGSAAPRMVDTGADGDLVFALHNMR